MTETVDPMILRFTKEEPDSLGDKLKRYSDGKHTSALRRLLNRYNMADIAEAMETELEIEQAIVCFQQLTPAQAAEILIHLSEEYQITCLSAMPPDLAGRILRIMASDDAVDILQELTMEQRQNILDKMPFDKETRDLHRLLMEEPDTAAGLMSTDFIKLSVEETAGQAMRLIKQSEKKDFIYYCYLVDSQDRLVGVVSLKELLLQDENVPLQQVATFDVKSILVTFDQELVANLFRKYNNILAMPVVDQENILRGIITLDDIVYVIDEESSEDIYRASGINLEAIDEKNLLTGPISNAVKARMPWLMITVVGQFLATIIISSFSTVVAAAPFAFAFMPLLSGLAGNMGTQSETIAVRGLALNLVNDDNIREKYVRELKVALTTGLFFGVVIGILSLILYRNSFLSALLFASIALSILFSTTMGILLPYSIQRYFKMDPAGVGGPFITTFTDVIIFSAYLYLLSMFLSWVV